jgi:hypothetical protein
VDLALTAVKVTTMNRNTTSEGDSESGGHYTGGDPSSKGGPAANRLRPMTTEELEEMEPGFAIRFDEEWERIFNKKRSSTSDRRRRKRKGKKLGKKVGPRRDSNSNPRGYGREIGPDPPRPGRHGPSSTIFS